MVQDKVENCQENKINGCAQAMNSENAISQTFFHVSTTQPVGGPP